VSLSVYRDLIISLAARHKLPAVYPYDYLVTAGGLMSYGPDYIDQYRRAAECPLSGVKRTWLPHRKMSANDPKRTLNTS
jgi:hypothetical protein